MTLASGVVLPTAAITEICHRYQVKELSVFGSAARGGLRPESDIDLLVEFEPGAGLKPLVRPEVLAEARVIYAA